MTQEMEGEKKKKKEVTILKTGQQSEASNLNAKGGQQSGINRMTTMASEYLDFPAMKIHRTSSSALSPTAKPPIVNEVLSEHMDKKELFT